jgi:hypothetical protein
MQTGLWPTLDRGETLIRSGPTRQTWPPAPDRLVVLTEYGISVKYFVSDTAADRPGGRHNHQKFSPSSEEERENISSGKVVEDAPRPGPYAFRARPMLSVPSNLKGCQILAGGKAQGRHPRNSSGDKCDPGGVVESADSFIVILGNLRLRRRTRLPAR